MRTLKRGYVLFCEIAVLTYITTFFTLHKIEGILNLSTDSGNIGIMHITNLRVVWHSCNTPEINISVPFRQLVGFKPYLLESNYF